MTRRSRRNVVLAPITRWLWWSPWRLFSTVGVGLVLVAIVFAALRAGHRPLHRFLPRSASAPVSASAGPQTGAATALAVAVPGAAASAAAVAAPPSPLPTAVTATIALPAAATDRANATAAATGWVRLWARPTVPAGQWLAALTPGTFRDYLPTLATVDPANVPADAVAGPAAVTFFATGAARIAVPVHGTAGATHIVVLQLIWYQTSAAGRWVVSGVDGG